MRLVDRIAAWLMGIFGVAHLAVGHAVFIDPTERRIWFASAGFLLIMTGLANLSVQERPTRMNSLTAAFGNVSILGIALLLALASPNAMTQPQALVLLLLAVFLAWRRIRELAVRREDR